jgi:hypothetical protein
MVECIEQLPKIKYMLGEKLRGAGNLLKKGFCMIASSGSLRYGGSFSPEVCPL